MKGPGSHSSSEFPRFSSLYTSRPQSNRLHRALERHREKKLPLLDLTVSNPSQAELDLPLSLLAEVWKGALAAPYQPDPRGHLEARRAICLYYRSRGRSVEPEQLLLTASTSEAYSLCFKLFCDPGDEVLIPSPSYPLLEDLCRLERLEHIPYQVRRGEQGWYFPDELPVSERTRILLLVDPNNPTGSFIKPESWIQIEQFCRQHRLLLMTDEVFSDYRLETSARSDCGGPADLPSVRLNGISKIAGLPQLKLAWILVEGSERFREKTLSRLEVIADSYLSVNTPIQICLPEILMLRNRFQGPILQRLGKNSEFGERRLAVSSAEFLRPEAGWNAVIRLPRIRSDEEWALELLRRDHLFVHPGYLFGFEEEGHVVVSLITPETVFQQGLERLHRRLAEF